MIMLFNQDLTFKIRGAQNKICLSNSQEPLSLPFAPIWLGKVPTAGNRWSQHHISVKEKRKAS